MAARGGHIDIVRLLLDRGADLNKSDRVRDVYNSVYYAIVVVYNTLTYSVLVVDVHYRMI